MSTNVTDSFHQTRTARPRASRLVYGPREMEVELPGEQTVEKVEVDREKALGLWLPVQANMYPTKKKKKTDSAESDPHSSDSSSRWPFHLNDAAGHIQSGQSTLGHMEFLDRVAISPHKTQFNHTAHTVGPAYPGCKIALRHRNPWLAQRTVRAGITQREPLS